MAIAIILLTAKQASANCFEEGASYMRNSPFSKHTEHFAYGESSVVEYAFDKDLFLYRSDSIHYLNLMVFLGSGLDDALVYGTGGVIESVKEDMGFDSNDNEFFIVFDNGKSEFLCSNLSSLSEDIIDESVEVALSRLGEEEESWPAKENWPDETKYPYRDLAPVVSCSRDKVQFDFRALDGSFPDNTRSFANGEVHVALLNNGSHSVPSHGLVIWHPPRYFEGQVGEFGIRECHVVQSFFGIDWEGLTATYDPTLGLQLHTHVWITHEGLYLYKKPMTIRIHQGTGEVRTYVGETSEVLGWDGDL